MTHRSDHDEVMEKAGVTATNFDLDPLGYISQFEVEKYAAAAAGSSTPTSGTSPPFRAAQVQDLPVGYSYRADGVLMSQQNDGTLRPATRFELDQIQAAREAAASAPRAPSVSVSLRDPAALAQEQVQFEAEFGERLRQNRLEGQQALENMRFLREKLTIETESNRRREALATQTLIEQVQTRLESNAIARQRIELEQSQFRAEMRFAQQRFAFEQQQFQVEQRRGIARDIAEFSREPGDVGAAAALTLAQGGSPVSTSLARGADVRTAESVEPLELLFDAQEQLQRGFMGMRIPSVQPTGVPTKGEQGAPRAPLSQAAMAALLEEPGAIGSAGGGIAAPGGLDDDLAATTNLVNLSGRNSGITPTPAEDGGRFSPGIAEVHDDEIVVGDFVVIPKDQLEDAPKAQAGGIFEGLFRGAASTGTSGRRSDVGQVFQQDGEPQRGERGINFLNRAADLALKRSPFSRFPTPVGVSAPGTSGFLQELAAGVTGIGRGVPRQLFFEELLRSRPVGVQPTIVGRTT